ncbi:hypothetical protein [Thioclava sp. DLFJ5-1]|uniref:hypothetical protein n=1 Tax=Thioclava sp. DLFJ5-1 TaxID=1915314 RepID=UPI00117E3805|nr:hypothetical protein [Thioclava sp. DLFJ5-1]
MQQQDTRRQALTHEMPKTVSGNAGDDQKRQISKVFSVRAGRKYECLIRGEEEQTEEDRELLHFLQANVLFDFLQEQEHAPTRKRLRSHSKQEKHRLMLAGAVALALQAQRGGADTVFATINLRDGEPHSQALRNMRRVVLQETGVRISWAGVFVPVTGRTRKTQAHVHVLICNLKVHSPAWDAVNRFMNARNRKLPRSCHMTWAFGLDGLAQYLEGKKNLCRRGAEVIKTDDVLREAEKLCRYGFDALRETLQGTLQSLSKLGCAGSLATTGCASELSPASASLMENGNYEAIEPGERQEPPRAATEPTIRAVRPRPPPRLIMAFYGLLRGSHRELKLWAPVIKSALMPGYWMPSIASFRREISNPLM